MTKRLTLAALLCGVTVHAVSYTKLEQITVAASSIGFTVANINQTTGAHPAATSATCRLEAAQIRYTLDTTVPTTTVGVLLEIGDVLTLNGNDTLNTFRAIRTGGTSGMLSCHFFGSF